VREFVLKDGMITKREAAENAGYAAESAAQRAYELTDPRKHPNVGRPDKRAQERTRRQIRGHRMRGTCATCKSSATELWRMALTAPPFRRNTGAGKRMGTFTSTSLKCATAASTA